MISRRTRNDTDVELGGDATAPEQDDKVIVGSDGFIEWGDPIAGSVLCVSRCGRIRASLFTRARFA
eukprot:scaffold4097_cov306-Pinguiococcus_pyrenoidosus.AAC.10